MLLQLEIIVFFASFGYIIYYFSDSFFSLYTKKKQEALDRIQRQKLRKKQLKWENTSKDKSPKWETIGTKKTTTVPYEHGEQIREISKRAQVNISRWYYESARSLIIEWLALKKQDKDLNLLLADVYERERKYQNAEFIYRDLLDEHDDDEYILQRLWNIYVLRWKNKKAISCYGDALKHDRANTEILDILTHLHLEELDFKRTLKYTNLYLKEKPRNAEKLSIRAYSLEMLWKPLEAVKAYQEVLNIQPYNNEIIERIKSIETK